MENKIVTLDEFRIAGISIRTSNENAMRDIPLLWQRFHAENIYDKILGKVTNEVVALYTNYESDFTKPYTLIRGCKITNEESIPDGLESALIPPSKYFVVTAKGKMPESIIEVWKDIWNLGIKRSYTGDFEIYDQRYSSASPEADIFISFK